MEILNYLLMVVMTATFSAVLLNSKPYIWLTEWMKLPIEPFRCALCSSFWIGTVTLALLHYPFLDSIFGGALIAFIAEIQDRKLNS